LGEPNSSFERHRLSKHWCTLLLPPVVKLIHSVTHTHTHIYTPTKEREESEKEQKVGCLYFALGVGCRFARRSIAGQCGHAHWRGRFLCGFAVALLQSRLDQRRGHERSHVVCCQHAPSGRTIDLSLFLPILSSKNKTETNLRRW